MATRWYLLLIAALGSGCQFNPKIPTKDLAFGEVCTVDAQCASGLCASSCVECRPADPCANDGACVDGQCVIPPVAEIDNLGGTIQVDTKGRKHRGRVTAPAVTAHRATERTP